MSLAVSDDPWLSIVTEPVRTVRMRWPVESVRRRPPMTSEPAFQSLMTAEEMLTAPVLEESAVAGHADVCKTADVNTG